MYPKITYSDIGSWLFCAPSPVTAEELKCYKSMEAYNQFLCVWLKEIVVKLFEGGICLILEITYVHTYIHTYIHRYIHTYKLIVIMRRRHLNMKHFFE